MDAVTLHYAAHTSVQSDPNGPPTTSETRVRVGVTATELIVDDGETAQRFEFDTRRRTVLRHGTKTAHDSSLLAFVHDCEAGLVSAVHVLEVLRAGAAIPDAATWQAEAHYSMAWRFGGSAPELEIEIERIDGEHGSRWCVGERELTHVVPVSEPTSLPAKALMRLLGFALIVHPQVAAALAEQGVLPRVLTTDDHFPLQRRICRYELESIQTGTLDFAAMAAGYTIDPPADQALALIGRRSDRPPSSRLDDARAALERGELVEAMSAVFTHNWAFVDNTNEIVGTIFDRARWLSPVKRIPELLPPANSPERAAAQIRGLEKLRRKAGRYAYALDVLIGEKHVERREHELAGAAFSAALACDPELAATWVSLGRTYAARLRFTDAWDCFAYADALCPQHKVVGDIHQLDAGLRARYPSLF